MNRTDNCPARDLRKMRNHASTTQLTGYESPQRRRFLRELAEAERCGE
ncbi:hypothetical protein [Synechococcus sp. M16CYN]